jgi:hypothetical protein
MSINLTEEIYEHQHKFLVEASEYRPVFSGVLIKEDRLYSANAYVLFNYPLAEINKFGWLYEHIHQWGNEEDETGVEYWEKQAPDDSDDDFDWFGWDPQPDVSKIDRFLPCGLPTLLMEDKFPNVDLDKDWQWEDKGEVDPAQVLSECYKQRRKWLGLGLPLVHLNGVTALVEYWELVLNFPLVMQANNVRMYTYKSEAIKVVAGDTIVLFMGYEGDADPRTEAVEYANHQAAS